MADVQIIKLSVALLASTLCFQFLIAPTMANTLDSGKFEQTNDGVTVGGSEGVTAGSGAAPSAGLFASRRSLRSIYGVGPRMLQISRSKIPIELDLLVESDNGDRLKRFDDYGHMRFGKRGGEEQFDDYGHMRFGRSV